MIIKKGVVKWVHPLYCIVGHYYGYIKFKCNDRQGRPQKCSSEGAKNCKYINRYLWEDLSLHLSSTNTL